MQSVNNQKYAKGTFSNFVFLEIYNLTSFTFKSVILLLTLLFVIKAAISQEYSFPLYLEDALGNKDTLHFGFDESATFGIDENLGEINVVEQNNDSAFFPFFTDAVTNNSMFCDLSSVKSPTYISKQQYVNISNSFFIEMGIIAQNWPVKISWDSDQIASFDINGYSGYSRVQLILASQHPPGGWFDALCCGSGLDFIILSDTTNCQIDQGQLCSYNANFSNQPVNLIYLGLVDITTSVKSIQTNNIKCWYSQKSKSIQIENVESMSEIRIELFSLLGSKIYEKQIYLNQDKINLDAGFLNDGIYVVRISDAEKYTTGSIFKIAKR